MRSKGLLGALGASVALTVVASGALASSSAGGVVIKAKEASKVVINKYIQDGVHFAPGTVTVKSGSTLTFDFADRNAAPEPHTLTIVNAADLPKTIAQVNNCKVCQQLASPHLKNPKAPPSQSNGVAHWTLNKGAPGLDTVGDSIAIQEPGPHKSITVKVTAKPGTTLSFVCAVHPWMQGKIVVK
jgi:plastocyanin